MSVVSPVSLGAAEVPSFALPDHVVHCRPGDHLAKPAPDGQWLLYRVEDLVLVDPLVVLANGELIEEAHLRDSVAPRMGGVHLLLNRFGQPFPSADAAFDAARRGGGDVVAEHVCLSIEEFPADAARRLPAATTPPSA